MLSLKCFFREKIESTQCNIHTNPKNYVFLSARLTKVNELVFMLKEERKRDFKIFDFMLQ